MTLCERVRERGRGVLLCSVGRWYVVRSVVPFWIGYDCAIRNNGSQELKTRLMVAILREVHVSLSTNSCSRVFGRSVLHWLVLHWLVLHWLARCCIGWCSRMTRTSHEGAEADTAETDHAVERAALLFASFYKRTDDVRKLLKGGNVTVGSANKALWTPLCTAAWHGCTSTLVVLIDEYEADMEVVNEFGWTPLLAASMQGHVACVKELLARGARLDARAKTGKARRTPASGCCGNAAHQLLRHTHSQLRSRPRCPHA
jgi:hypothetical protein